MRGHVGFGTALSALLAIGLSADAGEIDVPLGNGDRVTGTLNPSGETDTFRVVCPAHAKLSITASGRKAGRVKPPVVRFELLDGNGAQVAAAVIKTTATGASLKGFDVPATGEYRIVVSTPGTVAGDFQLVASWKSPAKFAFTGTFSGADVAFPFAAELGAVPTIDVSAAPRTTTQPRVARIDANGYIDAYPVPPAGSKRHKVKAAALPRTGEYSVTVSDAGGAGGAFRGSVSLKPPRASKRNVLLTDAVIGGSAGDGFAKGAVVGPLGGILNVAGNADTTIAGASVAVPAGAIGFPTSLVVATAKDIAPPAGSGGAGPTVFFGPEGLTFGNGQKATVTIPFDPALFGGNFAALRVFTRDAKGKVTEVTQGLVVDAVTNTVSFPAAHFSSFRVFGPQRRSPFDLNADGFDDLVVPVPGDQNDQGAVFVYFGRPDFGSRPPTAPDAVFQGAAAGDHFGASFVTGDANGDGIADLLVGAPRAGNGKVFAYEGGTGFTGRATAAADATYVAGAGDARFGSRLLLAEVTGDGSNDLLVADDRSSVDQPVGGAVYVFRGTARTPADPGVITLTGHNPDDHFGVSLAAGDLDADGTADLVVGADQLGNTGAGLVHVFPGGPTLASQRALTGTSIDFLGDTGGDGFGSAVAVGDLNADGRADLAIGVPFMTDPFEPLNTRAGSFVVFYGGPGFAALPISSADWRLVFGPEPDLEFGASLSIADVYASSTADLLVTSPGRADRGPDSGSIYLIRGGTDFVPGAFADAGPVAGARMGILYPPVNVDGGAKAHPVVGMPTANGDAGRLEIILGDGLYGTKVVIDGTVGQRLGGND